MKQKISMAIVLLLLFSISTNAVMQSVVKGKSGKIYISVGDSLGADEPNALCNVSAYHEGGRMVLENYPLFYDSGSLYYFNANKQWNVGVYTATVSCESIEGSRSLPLTFNVEENEDNGDSNAEQKGFWGNLFGRLKNRGLDSGLANMFSSISGGIGVSFEILKSIPNAFRTIFNLFIWVINHIYIIILLFEIYAMGSAISKDTLTGQVSDFVQKQIYAIDFITRLFISIVSLAVRMITGTISAVGSIIPFT